MVKVRYLIGGHRTVTLNLQEAIPLLQREKARGNLIVDDEARQLTKVELLNEDSKVTVYPIVQGG